MSRTSRSRARSHARRFVMQALYQWQLGRHELAELLDQYLEQPDMASADRDYFREVLTGCYRHEAELLARIAPQLDRPPEQLDPVERAILLMATHELSERLEVPYRVVINEAVELAKGYGAELSHTYINGVLDHLARELRPAETGAG